MSEYIIETEDLKKNYRSGKNRIEVLKGIDLKIKKGEFLTIQGPSGAGKSTLLHILGNIDNPTSGKVFFDGLDFSVLSRDKRSKIRNFNIGFVFQFYHLLPEFNALENAILPACMKNFFEKKDAIRRARSIFEELDLSHRIYNRPMQLSGGEQQRVCIARALINEPDLLLCDEPTGNLDSDNGLKICRLLKDLNQKRKISILVVTHDVHMWSVSDREIHIKDGLIVKVRL